MNRILIFFKNYFSLFLFGIILIVLFLPFYREGRMIAGGEGSYLFDFSMILKNYGYSWSNSGTGIITTSLNFGYVFPLIFFQKLFSNERIINFIMVYSLYFLPFLAVYILSLELKLKPWIAFLIALFYITNPFTANFLKSINQWNMLVAYILPAFLWLILKFYDDSRKLFFFFGFHSLFFAFTNANPPTMVLYQIAIVIFIIFVSLYKENKLKVKTMVGKYFLVLSSFLLFNMWWIINWFSVLSDAQQGYTKAFALSWLNGAKMFNPAFWRVFTLTGLIQYPINPQYDYFTKYYSYSITFVLLLIPMAILIISLLMKKVFKTYHSFLMLTLLAIGFLSKGVNAPFGGIYEFLVRYFPFFSIFKSADEKWGILFVFLLTLYLILFLKDIKKEKFYRLILSLIIVYVGYNLVPFITSNFIPDYKLNQNVTGSRKFLNKIEYRDLRRELNNDQEQYRILSLPGSLNYQVALRIEGNRFYTGNDPILSNTNKPFIAPYNGTLSQTFPVLFDSISSPKYLNLLSLFNIKKIVINKDMYPWFGFQEKENIPQLERIFDEKLKSDKNSVIDLYDLGDYYLPRFYIPQKTIYSKGSIDNLMGIVSFDDYKIRSGIYLDEDGNWKLETGKLISRTDEIIIKASLNENFSDNELLISIPPDFLPYVSQSPDNQLYFIVLLKEKYDKWKVRNNPEELFKKELYFSNKRIQEFIKFPGLSSKTSDDIISHYRQNMESALWIAKSLNTKNLFIDYSNYLRWQKEELAKVDGFRKWEVVFNDLEKKAENFKAKRNFDESVYNFEIPKEGEYEIYIRDNGDIGNQILDIRNKVKTDDSWVNLGERNFEEGNQEISLPINRISGNVIDNRLEIKDYFPDSIYRINFNYQATEEFFLSIGEDDLSKELVRTMVYPTDGKTLKFEAFLKSSLEATNAGIIFTNDKNEKIDLDYQNLQVNQIYEPEVMLKNIKYQISNIKYQTPKITFVKINPTKYRVKIEGAVDPYTLVFSESFHEGWKAYISNQQSVTSNQQYGEMVASYFNGEIKEGTHRNTFLEKATFETWGKKPIPEDKHLLVNGYANSWYITPEDAGGKQDYELIIEFAPQRFFYIGLFVSLITLVSCLGYILLSMIKNLWKKSS